MSPLSPSVVLIAGPNGAGKSTVAPALLRGALGVQEFVNADVIAHGLSAFNVESVAITAGRAMLQRISELGRQRVSFAFETTLASRVFVPHIESLKESVYDFHLVFLWLPSPEVAIARVAERVSGGGHGIPTETIRRRYRRGIGNFFQLYQPLASTWRLYDNSRSEPALIASGVGAHTSWVVNEPLWAAVRTYHGDSGLK